MHLQSQTLTPSAALLRYEKLEGRVHRGLDAPSVGEPQFDTKAITNVTVCKQRERQGDAAGSPRMQRPSH